MDTPGSETPRRRWWRKKRWLAVGMLWLAAVYVSIEGPAEYAIVRGWLPSAPIRAAYRPADAAAVAVPDSARRRASYRAWWNDLAYRHMPRVSSVSGPGWKIVLSSDVDQEPNPFTGWPGRDYFVARVDGRAIVVENGRETPGGGLVWDGPVTADGRPVAALPAGTRHLRIDYFDGAFAVEADGAAVEVAD